MQPEKEKESEKVSDFSIVVKCPIYLIWNREIHLQPPLQLKGSNFYFPLPRMVAHIWLGLQGSSDQSSKLS